MVDADKETKEINMKVFRPAYKAEALEKKKVRIEAEANEAKRVKEELKQIKNDQKMENKKKREVEKGLKKVNPKKGGCV